MHSKIPLERVGITNRAKNSRSGFDAFSNASSSSVRTLSRRSDFENNEKLVIQVDGYSLSMYACVMEKLCLHALSEGLQNAGWKKLIVNLRIRVCRLHGAEIPQPLVPSPTRGVLPPSSNVFCLLSSLSSMWAHSFLVDRLQCIFFSRFR